MPQLNQYGISIDAGDVGDRQTPSAPLNSVAMAPIQIRKWIRNGKAPNVELANRLNESANYSTLYRTKEVFSACMTPTVGSLTATTKWRFACHTGPYAHGLLGIAAMLNPYLSSATQAKATLKIYSDVTETTLVGSADFYYGAGTNSGGFGWRQAKYPMQWIDGLSPDTDYYGRWDLSGSPNLLAASVWEMGSMTENFNGYLTQSLTMHSPILSIDRSNVHTVLKNLWKRGGAKVLNYVVQPGTSTFGVDSTEAGSISNTTVSTTYTNMLDRSSTAVSSSSPGWTIDLRYKDRVSQTSGVPCVLKVFGRATAPFSGSVILVNSAGTTIATATTSSTTNTWFSSGQFNMPAVLDKYDLMFKTTSGASRFYVYSASVFEYEA
jgi:hypothetical protein